MRLECSMSNLWSNPHLRDFFFRTQSKNTLKELLESVDEDKDAVFDSFENADFFLGCVETDWDDIEEILYGESIENIIKMFGLTPIVDDEDED